MVTHHYLVHLILKMGRGEGGGGGGSLAQGVMVIRPQEASSKNAANGPRTAQQQLECGA